MKTRLVSLFLLSIIALLPVASAYAFTALPTAPVPATVEQPAGPPATVLIAPLLPAAAEGDDAPRVVRAPPPAEATALPNPWQIGPPAPEMVEPTPSTPGPLPTAQLPALNRPEIMSPRAAVLYAAPTAQGSGNCDTWSDACTLQTALGMAQSGDEIWVMAGVHTPTTNPSDRTASFALVSGVAIYGGFAGGETQLEQRDWVLNLTVLSGDIDHNDTSDPHGVVTDTANITGTNSYHVVISSSGITNNAALDGFVITAGNANDASVFTGGGMKNEGGPTLANLTFSGNAASGFGGGMFNTGSPNLTNITFLGNHAAVSGGGIYNQSGSPTLTGAAFISNTASTNGGGIYNAPGSTLTLTDANFDDNAGNAGGGMYNYQSGLNLTNVTFSGNSANTQGGGMYSYQSSLTLNVITFTLNSAQSGGGMTGYTSILTMTNVAFLRNTTAQEGGGVSIVHGQATITHATFISNTASGGGGCANNSDLLILTDATFSGNSAQSGGGLYNSTGAISTTLNSVTFSNNTAANFGGGMHHLSGSASLTNVTFSGNSGQFGGGINSQGTLTLLNVTIANSAGNGIRNGGVLNFINTLIAGSTAQDCAGGGTIGQNINNLTEDGSCNALLSGDPHLGPLEDNGGDTLTHALLPGSPAIDAGNDAFCTATDQRGVERPKDGDGNGVVVCDIGAFELTNEIDYGDAPWPYPTLKTDNGARHYLRTGYSLGDPPDIDSDGFPSTLADGDDLDNRDDEDGVTFLTPVRTNDWASVYVTSSVAGYLHAWFDFNADGDWADTGEKFIPGRYLPAGAHTFTFRVPAEAPLGRTYARFRFTSRPLLSINGIAIDGEVEDYMVTIEHGRPVAVADTASLDENTSILIPVLANDYDPHETTSLQLAAVGAPVRGVATIEGDQIRYTPNPDYSGSDAFAYTIVNSVGLTETARVSLLVRNVNSRPTQVQLLNQQPLIATCDASDVCTLPADTLVGTLWAVDPDPGDTHTFSLVDGGDFRLSGAILYTRLPIVFTGNTQSIQRSLTVRATDSGNLTGDQTLTLFVLGDGVTGGPTQIVLSNQQIAENPPAGTLVGTLTTQEETPNPPYTYALVAGVGSNDNARFRINGDRLETAGLLDFEYRELYRVRVRTLNNIGQFRDEIFTIQLLDDPNEPPSPPPHCLGGNIELIQNGEVQMSVINVVASNVTLEGCDITGELVLSIPGWSGSGIAFAGEVNERNQVSADGGQIGPIVMSVAGLPLNVSRSSLEFYDGRPGLRLERASFCLPDEWGGLCAPATAGGVSLLIDDGGLRVGGELQISFPEIRVGNQVRLSGLHGKVVPVPGGYELTLGGEFGLPNFQPRGANGCGISASVTVYVGDAGERVMEITTLTPAEADAVRLREISVGIQCTTGIPIDNTGLALTGVSGTVVLRPDSQYVSLTLTVSSIARVPGLGYSLIRGDGTATLHWDPAWGLDLDMIVYLLETFRVSQTHIGVGLNRYSFTAHVTNYYIHGDLRIDAWTDWVRLHIAGRGEARIGLVSGSIYQGCTDFGLFEICVSIPPFDLYVTLGAEFGEFTNNQWGVKGYVQIPVFGRYGVYVDARPSLHVGGVDQYQLVTPPQILEALARRHAAGPPGTMGPFPPDAAIQALSDHQVVLRVPVHMPTPPIAPSEIITVPAQRDTLFALSSSERLTMTLRAPDGTVITPDNYNQPPVFPTYTVEYSQTVYYEPFRSDEYTLTVEPRLRFVLAATHPDWEEVDCSLDGVLLFANQRLDTPAPFYVPILSGDHLLSVAPSAGGTAITTTLHADFGGRYTALLAGDDAAPDLAALNDDLAPPSGAGMARLRFVHSAPYPQPVNVFVDGTPVLSSVTYPAESPLFEFPAGEVLVEIRDAISDEDIAPPQTLILDTGVLYSLFDYLQPLNPYSLAWQAWQDEAYLGRYYSIYRVLQAPSGIWEANLNGRLEDSLPMFAALGIANPPSCWEIEAHATDPFHPEMSWRLTSDYLPTTVQIYANPDEYMDPAWVYQGYRVAEIELTDPQDVIGEPFTYTVDLSALETGDYTLWMRVEDPVNPPVEGYALTEPYGNVAVFSIDQSATFPVAWSPTITTEVSNAETALFLVWDALEHPDVDHYNLYLNTEPLSPTLYVERLSAFRQTDADGQPFGPLQVYASVSNLVPGATYYYSVEAVDADGGRSVRSPEAAITIAGGDFQLTTPATHYTVAPGTQISFPLSLELLQPLFYPNVGLSVDSRDTAPGMRVWFETPLGGDAYLTEADDSVTVVVDLLPTVRDGIYPLTFVGANGDVRRSRTVYIVVNPVPTDLTITGEYQLWGQDQVTLTFTVTNLGAGRGDGAIVSIPFPPQISHVSWSCSGTGGTTCGSGVGDVSDTIGHFVAGGTATYTVAGVHQRFPPFHVTASVDWFGNDPNLENNTVTLDRYTILLLWVYRNGP